MSIRNILKSDVSIIGSGIIGNSIALSLQRKGYKVSVYDKNPKPGFGTTSYSSGICRMYYSLLDSARLSWEGYHYFENWRDSIRLSNKYEAVELNECGALIFRSDKSNEFINKTSKIMEEIGVPVEYLDLEETNKKVSSLGMDVYNNYETLNPDHMDFGYPKKKSDLSGSIYMKKSGYISDPQLAANNLYQAAKDEGVDFNFNSLVDEIIVDKDKIKGIHLKEKVYIESPIVINACGPYSSQINELAYMNTDMESDINITSKPLRIEVSYTDNLDNMLNPTLEKVDVNKNGMVIIDLDCGVYFRPDVGNKFLIGATEPECDELVWVDDLDDMNDGITEQWLNQMYRAALRMPTLPIPSGTNKKFVVSTYDVTDDWTPIYDKSNIEGYYMAYGSSGNQFKNAGAIGPMMADLVDSCESGLDHDTNPLQHKLKMIDGEIDMSTFSRLREPKETTETVFG